MTQHTKTALLMPALIALILNSGCLKAEPLAVGQRPENWAAVVSAEHNLYRVSNWLYRSEQLSRADADELRQLGVSRIINLRSRDKDAQEFGGQGFHLTHVPIHTWKISRNDVLAVMRHLQAAHQQGQKVLIHCYHGSDRTGTMAAMYRIVFENWTIDAAVAEMKHGGYGFHSIWGNIDDLFTPDNIAWLKTQLAH
ncbi:dual specificity protein phosphatase family protein [Stenoxybacter acetivorans]|uniref:phosphatase domain-containing protein n=1 Tax=Stenoxybacter acetivorans TaxID=422441 RepID=UPI00056AC375|nr:tyrosine-protein phosphatase [Stenoxybacter acetivorans]